MFYRKKTKSVSDFVKKAKKIHKNKYDYSKCIYRHAHLKVKIICKKHGSFYQTPTSHTSGKGCAKCAGKIMSTPKFINKAKKIHVSSGGHSLYNYSKVKYIKSNKKVNVICKKHGLFAVTPNNHLNGLGCPSCSNYYKGEQKLLILLRKIKVKFSLHKTFKKCVDKRCLPFDFYIPKYNICIELDGPQHRKPTMYFSISKEDAINKFKLIQKHDNIKNDFCANNKINLLRIPYHRLKYAEKIITKYLKNIPLITS